MIVLRREYRRKEISYEIISDAPIASINKTLKDRIEIRLDGKPASGLNLLILKVWNSGNIVIKAEDYLEPITFRFEGRIVVDTDILEMEPRDLIPSKDLKTFLISNPTEPESVELPKFPLNAKESIGLKILLMGTEVKIGRRGRIADGKLIENNPNNQPIPIRISSLITLLFVMLTVVAIASFSPLNSIYGIVYTRPPSPNAFSPFGLFLVILLIIMSLVLIVFRYREEISQIKKNGIRFRR